jgi:hypothetical protein
MEDEQELSERREHEFEALRSIYGDDLSDLREKDIWKVGRPPEMKIHLEPLNTSNKRSHSFTMFSGSST